MRFLILMMFCTLGYSMGSNAQKSPNFTLQNPTAKSIPLWIPSVMNPNLSPFSKSGVTLKVGQKIYFKHKRRKRVLLVVNKDLDGKTLNVAKLIKEKKKN